MHLTDSLPQRDDLPYPHFGGDSSRSLILTGPEVAAARPKCPHHLTTPRGVVCVSFRTGCGRRNRVEISIEKGWVTGKDQQDSVEPASTRGASNSRKL